MLSPTTTLPAGHPSPILETTQPDAKVPASTPDAPSRVDARPAAGPLAPLLTTIETDPALQPHATIFFTPDGRKLADGIDALNTYPELLSAAALSGRIADAAAALAARQGRGVLMLGGAHHSPGSLMQFHAAVDACQKYDWPLLLEIDAISFKNFWHLIRFLGRDPALRQKLGDHTLFSRQGQKVVWDYVRNSTDRSVLQKFLPELLGYFDIQRSGVRVVHVDPLGPAFGTDEEREDAMVRNSRRALQKNGKGVLVLGLLHGMPMHRHFSARGVECREIALLDESVNHAWRCYDGADDDTPVYEISLLLANNIALPQFALAARQTETYRMPDETHPFG